MEDEKRSGKISYKGVCVHTYVYTHTSGAFFIPLGTCALLLKSREQRTALFFPWVPAVAFW